VFVKKTKPKPRNIFKKNYLYFILIPAIGIAFFFSFRKTVTDTSINARLEATQIELQKTKEENDTYKKLYFDLNNVKEDYRKQLVEISDLLFLKPMPVGGATLDPIRGSDQLTIKAARNTVESFKELQSSFHDIKGFLVTRKMIINDVPFVYPLRGDGTVRISSGYGYRKDPLDENKLSYHGGVDLVANTGDPVQATADGIVEDSENSNPGYGMVVVLKHTFIFAPMGFETLYGHLSEINVKYGQKVKRGDIVGRVGISGETTGPHLHYEIRIGGNPIDPMNFLSSQP
jgi:murein DD-endopeptidase MepM/ murein hydrolase activator NlpD